MRILMALLVVSLASGMGCKKKDTTSQETPGSAAVTGSGSAEMGAGSDLGSATPTVGVGDGSAAGSAMGVVDEKMSRKGGNCPSTVAGSTTKAALEGATVVVTVTAEHKDAIAAIQKRGAEVLKAKTDGGAAGQGHDQNGMHGGGVGLCPVHIADGATAEVKNEDKGIAVTITPKDKPEALKSEIDARIVKAEAFVKTNVNTGPNEQGSMGGVGGGSGDHGMNHSGKGDGKGGGKGDGGGGGGGTGSGSAAK